MRTILHTLLIHASPERVFQALTTEEGVTGWWTTKATVEKGEGGLIRFTFLADFHPHMQQTRLKKPSRVEWKCVDGHTNWQDDTFTFELRAADDDTSVRFTQQYTRELDDDVYGNYNFNWGYYLNSLKRYCEDGEGSPFQVES